MNSGFLDKVREICGSFYGAEEKPDELGHITFKVKDKSFVRIGEMDGVYILSIKTSPLTQEILINQENSKFVKTAYIGQHGWVSIRSNDIVNWEELSELIKEAYYRTAPKKYLQC
ncbi:MmcQ/YjbR family DNA-binding protein [Paenibacillus alkalitolerans]|uniref:MmcQ/YjbR family DNA-binding protein n=1 Tax=Paenibacillus alkalitolerans TaxID=2799335 RepID=UPI0018F6947C|nr:MmcQ/YjbR family DNA-binding protein [Paenibacillus alkalitolerans]